MDVACRTCVCVYGCGVQDTERRRGMLRSQLDEMMRRCAQCMPTTTAHIFFTSIIQSSCLCKGLCLVSFYLHTLSLLFLLLLLFPLLFICSLLFKIIVHISRGDGAIGFLLLLFREVQVLTQKILRNLHFLFTSILYIRSCLPQFCPSDDPETSHRGRDAPSPARAEAAVARHWIRHWRIGRLPSRGRCR